MRSPSPPERPMSWDQLYAFAQSSPILSIAFLGLSAALVVTEVMRLFSGFKSISPAQATLLMNREDALLVDVSPSADFSKGHILGSISAPMADFDPLKNAKLNKAAERPVIVVCRAGNTAGGAATRLIKAGFKKVSVLEGGIAGWRQADLPVTKSR